MKTYSLIDLGSSSVKLIIFQVDDKGGIVKKYEDKMTVNLAENFYPQEIIKEEPIKRVLKALIQFNKHISTFGVDTVKLISTGVARKAKNVDIFKRLIKDHTGLDIEIISGQEEAELLYKGVINDFEEPDRKFLIINIGGGTTEVIYGDKKNIEFLRSVPIGVSEINEKYIENYPISDNLFDRLENEIKSRIKKLNLPSIDKQTIYIHTGGELAYMKALKFNLVNSDLSSPAHPLIISIRDFKKRAEEIRNMTKEELYSYFPKNPKWLNGAVACNTIAICIAEKCGFNFCVPSDKNLLDGIVLEVIKNTI